MDRQEMLMMHIRAIEKSLRGTRAELEMLASFASDEFSTADDFMVYAELNESMFSDADFDRIYDNREKALKKCNVISDKLDAIKDIFDMLDTIESEIDYIYK